MAAARGGRKLWLWLVAVGAISGACAYAWPRVLARVEANIELQPGVAMLSVRPGPAGIPTSLPDLLRTSADFTLAVHVRNRNWIGLRLMEVTYRAMLNGREFAHGVGPETKAGVNLPADGAAQIKFRARVPLQDATLAGVGAVASGSAKVELRGQAAVEFLGVDVVREFSMPIPDLRVDMPLAPRLP